MQLHHFRNAPDGSGRLENGDRRSNRLEVVVF